MVWNESLLLQWHSAAPVHDSTADYVDFTLVVKAHLKELISRTVAVRGWWDISWLIGAPLQFTEAVDAIEVAGVQLGKVDVREVGVQAVRTHLLLSILNKEMTRDSSHWFSTEIFTQFPGVWVFWDNIVHTKCRKLWKTWTQNKLELLITAG